MREFWGSGAAARQEGGEQCEDARDLDRRPRVPGLGASAAVRLQATPVGGWSAESQVAPARPRSGGRPRPHFFSSSSQFRVSRMVPARLELQGLGTARRRASPTLPRGSAAVRQDELSGPLRPQAKRAGRASNACRRDAATNADCPCAADPLQPRDFEVACRAGGQIMTAITTSSPYIRIHSLIVFDRPGPCPSTSGP